MVDIDKVIKGPGGERDMRVLGVWLWDIEEGVDEVVGEETDTASKRKG